MKRIHLISFLVCALFCACTTTFAQTSNLTKEEMEQFKERAKLKVDQFNNYISFIAKKKRYKNAQEQNEAIQNKKEYIKEALKLFIGGGKESKDCNGNIIPAPEMETSSLNRVTRRVTIKSQKISSYLNHMMNLNYTDVRVTASDAYFASEARQISENEYRVVLTYSQNFYGYRDGRVVYSDKTDKSVEVYIIREKIDGRVRWNVLLGNIKVDATEDAD